MNDLLKQLNFLNYISVASLYLQSNYFLEKPLTVNDIKPRILGHFGTVPALNLIYSCSNLLISKTGQKSLFITGPGHGAPAILANLFLEGTLSEYYKEVLYNKEGAEYLIKSFSWPKRFPSHTYPGLPGSIHEGGELGYSLGTAFGAMFDSPEQMAIVVVGDGEAETGTLAASWHSNKFYNPQKDGFVLPIVNLNGYKISNPTILATMSDLELTKYFEGLGYQPIIVSQYDSQDFAKDTYLGMQKAYEVLLDLRQSWEPGQKVILPVLLLRSMKGWTGPSYNKDTKLEDNNYSHGIPLKNPKKDTEELVVLEKWLKSYSPEEFFETDGSIAKNLLSSLPNSSLRMGKNSQSQTKDPLALNLPDLKTLSLTVKDRGVLQNSELEIFANYMEALLSDVKNLEMFRIFSPDESESNFLEGIFKKTKKVYQWPVREWDKNIDTIGHFMEILSEQVLQTWYSGYVLTGRYGVLVSYEAFLSIIASQIDQYIKFLRQSQDFSWRSKLPPLVYIATSSVWRQDHNGFTHQNPILINTLLSKHVDFVDVYFPCDANSMLVTLDQILQSRSTVNLIVAGKTNMPQWLTLEEADKQITNGLMQWDFATNSESPDVVLTSAGDYQTLETLAGIDIIRRICPVLKYRYINVSILSCKGFGTGTSKVMTEAELNNLYTSNRDVIFNFHGYPEVIKQVLFDTCLVNRTTIVGYIEKGTTTTPFDMQVKNLTSRYHIAILMLEKAAKYNTEVEKVKDQLVLELNAKIAYHKEYIEEFGDDMEEIKNWKWGI